MKLLPDEVEGVNVISHIETGRIRVNGTPHTGHVLVPWAGEVIDWTAASFESLSEADFEQVLECKPELVIFGSGAKLRFCKPVLLRSLIERRIGVETMDTAAACRTFNVLAGEGRRVVATLLI
ncbi:Mth938-like domain-containing protein [soil metagenome]